MAHVLKYSEWETGSGNYVCNDVSDLGGQAGLWWVPAIMLEMTPSEYVQWLVDNYHPDHLSFDGKTLIYSWTKQHYALMHKMVLYINKVARNKNFLV